MTGEKPKVDVGGGLAAIPPSQTPSATDTLATKTSAAAGAAVENQDSAVRMMKQRLVKDAHTSPASLNILEPMPASQTGVGVRAKDGAFYEVVFIWDNYGKSVPMFYLKRMLHVEGPSLDGTFETESAFYIASYDVDPLGSIQQAAQRNNGAFECQHALANNPALAGKLSVGGNHESGIRIVFTGVNNREFVFYLSGDKYVAIYERGTHYSVPGSFDPNTVTAEELDGAINKTATSL